MYAHKINQSGNVLFLILIAVALFAALSYAVTQSSRSGGSNADKEKTDLQLNVIADYASDLRVAVTRIMAAGCSDQMINTTSPSWSQPWPYTNERAPADESCNIFSPKGGGVVWQKPAQLSRDTGAIEYVISGSMNVSNVGTGQNEMLFFAQVPRQACLDVNTKLGISNPSGNPPYDSFGNSLGPPCPNYMCFGDGTHNSPDMYYVIAGDVAGASTTAELRGRTEGCFHNTNGNKYYYYSVLLAR